MLGKSVYASGQRFEPEGVCVVWVPVLEGSGNGNKRRGGSGRRPGSQVAVAAVNAGEEHVKKETVNVQNKL